ncbi:MULTISPECIES: hypothetical protein [Sphingobium]|uniref:Uncharacterized protein n=1 Tax=Sphingobium lignivorans TaxID=2735886 RepID=A0ABR6ND72_9SPHN|nr:MULTISPECIES: hypothetical protein [Sphingobium]MBB5985214.1 hypothetical protein [Sphingobium lignivorans]BAK65923.1 hypothetical protein SLG_12480 [Sphingobium sp. SYK-6]
MRAGAVLTDALKSFAAVEKRIVELGPRLEPSTASEFVMLRRDLVLEFARLGNALETDPQLKAEPELLAQGTRLLAAFRTENSRNQADWPVIRVRDNVQQYRIAAQSVAHSSRAFWQWVEQQFDLPAGTP